MIPAMLRVGFALAALWLCIGPWVAAPAWAWLAPGHMAAAAITYDELEARDPAAVRAIVAIMQSHPDRGRFDRRLVGLTGSAYDRRLFELMARWPDDARRTAFDHPVWHYSEQVQSGLRHVLPFGFGLAPYAFHRELAIALDPTAPAADRAVALCWVMHIVEDIHEPMHTGMWMSPRFPFTDRGGTIAWVRTAPASRPETLHWLWDSVGAADPDEGRRRDPDVLAAKIEAEYPAANVEDGLRPQTNPDHALTTWIRQSRQLARHLAYQDGRLAIGTAPQSAPVVPSTYLEDVRQAAERQIAVVGQRTADLFVGVR